MASSREVLFLDRFDGGLNLAPQESSLRFNESPDMLNVDVVKDGGFVLRGGFQTQASTANLTGAHFLGATYFGSDVVLVAGSDGKLYHWNGSTLTDTTEDLSDTSDHMQMATFNDTAYISNGKSAGNIIMQSWNGSTLTTLANTFNDDYLVPDGGDMPQAKHIVSSGGFMWVADTVESAVRYPHRVRFSHLQNPTDWATADYFDVDPTDDGDPITAIVPFSQMLLVFKRSAVYGVYGYDRDTFVLERLSASSGVAEHHAVSVSENKAYWFSTDGELLSLAANNAEARVEMDKLRWWSESGKIQHAGDHDLMWFHGRLWMSLEAGPGETVSRWLFVWDPELKALTRYDKVVVEMFNWFRLEQDADPLFLFENDTEMYRFDRSYSVDKGSAAGEALELVDGVTDLHLIDGATPLSTLSSPGTSRILGYYCTRWIDAGETATKKRWKRPRVTAASEGDATVTIDVFHDYNAAGKVKSSDLVIDGIETSQWGSMVWDVDKWGTGQENTYKFTRQPSGGSSHLIKFKFSSTDNAGRWWVDSIAIPFRRKSVR